MDLPRGLNAMNRFTAPTYKEENGRGTFNNGYSSTTFDVPSKENRLFSYKKFCASPMSIVFEERKIKTESRTLDS